MTLLLPAGLRWMPLHLIDDKSTLVQVMACCRQATSHYRSQCWPRSMPQGITIGLNELCVATRLWSIQNPAHDETTPLESRQYSLIGTQTKSVWHACIHFREIIGVFFQWEAWNCEIKKNGSFFRHAWIIMHKCILALPYIRNNEKYDGCTSKKCLEFDAVILIFTKNGTLSYVTKKRVFASKGVVYWALQLAISVE